MIERNNAMEKNISTEIKRNEKKRVYTQEAQKTPAEKSYISLQ